MADVYVRIMLGGFCLGRTVCYAFGKRERCKCCKFDVLAFKPAVGDQNPLEQSRRKLLTMCGRFGPNRLLKGERAIARQCGHFEAQSGSVPTPLRCCLTIWPMMYRVAAKGTAHLVEVTDVETAQFLAHDRGVSKHCYLAGDRQLVVPEKSLTAFRNALRKVGYILPK